MSKERTFLDPLNEAHDLAREIQGSISALRNALYVVGMNNLANNLKDDEQWLLVIQQRIEEGRQMMLSQMLGTAAASTVNMVNAALSAADGAKS